MSLPQLTQIEVRRRSRVLHLAYDDGKSYDLSFEYLRVYSPSAEVKGHGQGQEVLQVGKEDVLINDIQPVGNYAAQLFFDDGHDSGIYSWTYLHELATNQEANWQNYLDRLKAAGKARKADGPKLSVVQTFDPSQNH